MQLLPTVLILGQGLVPPYTWNPKDALATPASARRSEATPGRGMPHETQGDIPVSTIAVSATVAASANGTRYAAELPSACSA